MSFLDAPILEISKEGFLGGLSSTWKMVYIIIPLMVILEIAKYYKWIDKIIKLTAPLLKKIGLGDSATFPLLIGLVFGLLYGSGVMIDSAQQGEISKRDITLTLVFLVVCHSIFEDTFLFASLGINFFVLFFGRIIVAIFITSFFSKILSKKDEIKDLERIKSLSHKD